MSNSIIAKYNNLTVKELEAICKERKIIRGRSNKDELIKKLIKMDNKINSNETNELNNEINESSANRKRKRQKENDQEEQSLIKKRKINQTRNKTNKFNINEWINMDIWYKTHLAKLKSEEVRKLCMVCGVTEENNKTNLIQNLIEIHGNKQRFKKIQENFEKKQNKEKKKRKKRKKINKREMDDSEEDDDEAEIPQQHGNNNRNEDEEKASVELMQTCGNSDEVSGIYVLVM